MKTKLLTLLALLGLAFNFATQAEVQSGIVGDTETITVGATTTKIEVPKHPTSEPGMPGIKHINAEDKFISFATLQSVGDTSGDGSPGNWRTTDINPNQPGNPHGNLGYFNFVQVASEAVFFGEWSKDEASSSDPTHTVYYAGEAGNVIGNLPTQTATYTVVGINNGALLSGSLTANFGGDNQLTGEFSNNNLKIGITAAIDAENARFSGTATANEDGDYGFTEGHFFGNEATALAGIANFGVADPRNTAFGGAKD